MADPVRLHVFPRRSALRTDLVVIGAGAAGLAATLAAQRHGVRILLLCKGRPGRCGSTFANRNQRWGITFARNDGEREQLFAAIQSAGRGTNSPELSAILVEESDRAFRTLRAWGARFQTREGRLARVPPCFCPAPLAAVADDLPGLAARLFGRLDRSRVTVLAGTAACELLVRDNAVTGVLAKRQGEEILIRSRAVILATGGDAARFPANIVEPGLEGDGYRLLQRAGVPLANMEHRQMVWEDVRPAARRFPFTAFFTNSYRFLSPEGDPIGLPDPTSALARTRRGHVPISNLQPDREFDSHLLRRLAGYPAGAIRVVDRHGREHHRIYPHVQASNGGVRIGANGETSILGLFAAGEVTTGMHGGDRVGGTMIANCMVFGRRAGNGAARFCR